MGSLRADRLGAGRPATGVAALLIIIAISIAACGGQAGTSPSVAAPTASPTPFDVVSAFVGKLHNGLIAKATVSGTLDVGTVHGTLEGAYTFASDGSFEYEIVTRIGDSRSVSRGVHAGEATYAQEGYGPWLEKPQAAGSSQRSGGFGQAMMSGIASLRDTGVVTKGGQQVHALKAPGGVSIPASAMGISDPNVRDSRTTVDFYALDDGTPAGMTVTMAWKQGPAASAVDARMVMDLAFTTFGGSITVNPPDDVWKTFASKRWPYTVAYPGDWNATQDADGDFFASGDLSQQLQIQATKTSMSQKQWQADSAQDAVYWLKVRSDGAFAVEVAGIATRAVEYHGKLEDEETFVIDVPIVYKGMGYDIYWYGIPGYEDDDIAKLKTFLASFAFTK